MIFLKIKYFPLYLINTGAKEFRSNLEVKKLNGVLIEVGASLEAN